MIDEFKTNMGRLLFDYPLDASYSFEEGKKSVFDNEYNRKRRE